ncbi:hypothetical protein [Halorussus marinus]|uniref:hypothetical protein n=1 Tax=Halorussus marinus TaxID=2505976 RepID=UPI00106EBF65|nr:hypothetical protein [Halorussus marinus]
MIENRELHVGESGLWIPPELREFNSQIVIRTPRSTLQHFGTGPLDPYYGIIDESHFGSADSLEDARNPSLAPDRVSIKPQGEPTYEFEVDTDPDVRCDGGRSTDESERDEDWTMRMSNSPDRGPVELFRVAWRRYTRSDTDHDEDGGQA